MLNRWRYPWSRELLGARGGVLLPVDGGGKPPAPPDIKAEASSSPPPPLSRLPSEGSYKYGTRGYALDDAPLARFAACIA